MQSGITCQCGGSPGFRRSPKFRPRSKTGQDSWQLACEDCGAASTFQESKASAFHVFKSMQSESPDNPNTSLQRATRLLREAENLLQDSKLSTHLRQSSAYTYLLHYFPYHPGDSVFYVPENPNTHFLVPGKPYRCEVLNLRISDLGTIDVLVGYKAGVTWEAWVDPNNLTVAPVEQKPSVEEEVKRFVEEAIRKHGGFLGLDDTPLGKTGVRDDKMDDILADVENHFDIKLADDLGSEVSRTELNGLIHVALAVKAEDEKKNPYKGHTDSELRSMSSHLWLSATGDLLPNKHQENLVKVLRKFETRLMQRIAQRTKKGS